LIFWILVTEYGFLNTAASESDPVSPKGINGMIKFFKEMINE